MHNKIDISILISIERQTSNYMCNNQINREFYYYYIFNNGSGMISYQTEQIDNGMGLVMYL